MAHINPHFLEEAGEYLEANGYRRSNGAFFDQATIYFSKGDRAVAVKNDNVDFIAYDEGEPGQRQQSFSRYSGFTGITDLDIFRWMLLFHIADIVPFKMLASAAHQDDPAFDPVTDLMKHFRQIPSESTPAIPVNY